MHGVIDLNAGSGFVYGREAPADQAATRLNVLIDAALVSADRAKPPRDYLGASRIGEPCSRRLVYEYTSTPKDDGKDFDGGILRIFDAGHQFEDLCIRWLRTAGLGNVAYEEERRSFLGDSAELQILQTVRKYSEETAREIDRAVRDLVGRAFRRAREILDANRDLLDESANLLLARETLAEEELRAFAARIRAASLPALATAPTPLAAATATPPAQ